jgi:hypothetical protein
MAARGYAVHALLIKTEGQNIASRDAITRFSEQPLYAVCRVKTKRFSVGAAKDVVDLLLQRDIERVPRFFDDGIEHYEARAALQYPKYLLHDALRIGKMMQAKGNEGAVKRVGFKWQRIRFTGALAVIGNRVGMVVTNIKHRKRLIYTDDPAGLQSLRNRPRSPPGTGCQVKHRLVPLQGEHLDHLFRKRGADSRYSRAPVEFRRVRGIMKVRLGPGATAVIMLVFVGMRLMRMLMSMAVAASMVFVVIMAAVFVLMFVFLPTGAMRMAAPAMMIVVAPVRFHLGIVLRVTVAPLITARIAMIVFMFMIMAVVSVPVLIFVGHNEFLCTL